MPLRIKKIAQRVVNYLTDNSLVAKGVKQAEYVGNNYTAEEWFTTPFVTKVCRGLSSRPVTNETEAQTEAKDVMNENMGFQKSENKYIPRDERTDR